MRIFEQNLRQLRTKTAGFLCRQQGFLTQDAVNFAEKTCADFYENNFLEIIQEFVVVFLIKQTADNQHDRRIEEA